MDAKFAAFAAITGNASGTTPMQSAWMRVINVDTIAFTMTTAASTNGVWTAEVATNYLGADAIAVDSTLVSPAFPTGVNQSATPVITIPNRRYTHLRLTFTPSAGSGAVLANTGAVTSRGVKLERHTRSASVYFATPSTDTIAGQWALYYSPTHYDRDCAGIPTIDNINDPQVWTAAVDSSNSAISIAATITGGQDLIKRLGVFEPQAMRVKFTPTSGAGRVRCILNVKI
jgi:hypothetical protein